jgi:hypothetical protein
MQHVGHVLLPLLLLLLVLQLSNHCYSAGLAINISQLQQAVRLSAHLSY